MNLIVFQGLPRSGKSSLANSFDKSYKIIELDKYRMKLIHTTYSEDDEPFVWSEARHDALKYLLKQKNVIIDECNPTVGCLKFWIKLRDWAPMTTITIYRFMSTESECISRSDSIVLNKVIRRKNMKMMSMSQLKSWATRNNIELRLA